MLSNLLYIDPAATSALLSSIVAIGVALGATFIILWRKFKKKACQVLHIDENKNKEVEDELVITDESIVDESANATQETEVVENAETTEEVETTEKTEE